MCAICNVSLRRHVLFNFSVPDFVFLHDLSKYSWGHSLCTHRLCMNSPNFQPLHAETHRDNKYTNEKYSRWINAWINECTTKGWLCSCPTRFKCIFKSFFFLVWRWRWECVDEKTAKLSWGEYSNWTSDLIIIIIIKASGDGVASDCIRCVCVWQCSRSRFGCKTNRETMKYVFPCYYLCRFRSLLT